MARMMDKDKDDRGDRGGGDRGGYDRDGTPDLNNDGLRRRGTRKRVCKYCADKAATVDYKDPQALKQFITDRGKVVPRRISGNCAKHQRKVSLAISRARNIALLPFTQAH